MVEGVVAVDPLLRITFVNRAFAEMMGVALPIDARHSAGAGGARSRLAGDVHRRTCRGPAAAKAADAVAAARGRFEVQVAPLAGDPHRGAIAMLYDITDLERLERVRKDFVANVSHELRTPLAAVCGYAETLLEGGLEDPENSRQFVGIILARPASSPIS